MVDINKIPQDLRNINAWVCWQYEARNDKQTKVPKNPRTGGNAAVDDPATWASFDQAITAYQTLSLDGIGLVLTPDQGLVGLDCDHVLTDNTLAEWAGQVVSTVQSYTEVTPSDKGLRIFAYGELPPQGRKKGDFECYQSGRFLTVTGNHWPGSPLTVECRPVEVLTVHRMFWPDQAEPAKPAAPVQPVNLDDLELLQIIRASRVGSKFDGLWNGQLNGHPSHSEADQAMANYLAFFTGNDSQRIDRLFRQSGLMRDKWDQRHAADGQTYGQMTIAAAIAGTREVYTPPQASISISDLILPSPVSDQNQVMTWADLAAAVGPIEWDWPGWIAKGFQTLVASVPGEGKSNLILHVVRCYLTGCLWPDLQPFTGSPGRVLWVETESAQVLNLERAKKWGLPLESIITPLPSPLDNVSLDNPEHCAAVFRKAQHPDTRLVVVDSLSGGTRRESKSSNEMLTVGSFLADLAKVTGKPVLVSHHLNKNRNGSDLVTLDRVRDSSAIVQLARLVWAIDTPDAERPEAKRLYCIKNNLRRFPKPLGFEIDDAGLKFTDPPQAPKKETQEERAMSVLKNYIIARGNSVPAVEIEELAKIERISQPTLYRVKAKIGIISRKIGDVWYWSLPTERETI